MLAISHLLLPVGTANVVVLLFSSSRLTLAGAVRFTFSYSSVSCNIMSDMA